MTQTFDQWFQLRLDSLRRQNEWLEGHESVLIPIIGNGGGLFKVTRTQWQAERDRMKAMGTQQATASTEPTYEQQLWDRVASRRFDCDRAIGVGSGHAARNAYEDADAFMAERARRVGK